MIENTITVKVVVKPNGNQWDVALGRQVDDRIFPIINIGPCSRSEIYTKTGIRIPTEPPTELTATERLEAAKSILRDRLANLPKSTLTLTDEVQDDYLDILNLLGYGAANETTDTE